MKCATGGLSHTAESIGDLKALQTPSAGAGRAPLVSSKKLLSLALLVIGSLSGVPTLSGETASIARPSEVEQTLKLDAGTDRVPDALFVQTSGGYWHQANEKLHTNEFALGDDSRLAKQDPDSSAKDSGSVLTDPNEIARQSNNPLGGDFILWLNFIDIDKQQGDITDKDRYAYTHLLQPVIPIRMPQIGDNWILVNRPTFPTTIDKEVARRPSFSDPSTFEFDNEGGFGDIEYFALLGTSTPTKTGWLAESFGVGDTVLAPGFTTRWPTGENRLSKNVYAAGPAVTAAYVGKDWTFATLFQHWWDYKKQKSGADNFNFSQLQVFYFKSLPDGWQIGGSPKITADWSESSDDRWTVPIGIGVFKTILLGKTPIKLGVEFRPSLIRPDSLGTDWQIEFTIIPVTRNFIGDWFK